MLNRVELSRVGGTLSVILSYKQNAPLLQWRPSAMFVFNSTPNIQRLNPPLFKMNGFFCPWRRLGKGVRGTKICKISLGVVTSTGGALF